MVEQPDPVKLMVAALWSSAAALRQAQVEMERAWGAVDFQGTDHPFDMTDYYDAEMGRPLQRRLMAFEPLITPERIVECKLAANAIEDRLRADGARTVNLDVGYLDLHKLVLASGKFGPQKIYLDRGVYADLICRYIEGMFRPYEWTFADFQDRRYDSDLEAIRSLYKAELRGLA